VCSSAEAIESGDSEETSEEKKQAPPPV